MHFLYAPERRIVICMHMAMKYLFPTEALAFIHALSKPMSLKHGRCCVRNVLEINFRKQKLADRFAGILE